MSKAPSLSSKPSARDYADAIKNLCKETSVTHEEAKEAFDVDHNFFRALDRIGRKKRDAEKNQSMPPVQMEPPPIPDTKPAPVRWEPMAINLGDAANAPLTINLIEYIPANPYPKENRAKQFHSKLSRVMQKVMQEQRTPEQWAAFRRMAGATTFEYEGVEA